MDKIEKEMYKYSIKIKEYYSKMYETGSIDAHLKDFLFLLKEEKHLYQSLSSGQLANYVNMISDFQNNDIINVMLGNSPFDFLFRMINRLQYYLIGRSMYSEDFEMDMISPTVLMHAKCSYLYNETLFEHLFHYYHFFMNIQKENKNSFLQSLLLTAYTYVPLENRLVQSFLNQEQHLSNAIMEFSGIENIQESLDRDFFKELDACFESFINTDFKDMYHKEEEEIEISISQIFYLSLYSSISNTEMRNVFRNLYQPVNLPNLSLKHKQFLDEIQKNFTVCEYEKQFKIR